MATPHRQTASIWRWLPLVALGLFLAGCATPSRTFEPLAEDRPFAKEINAFTASDATNPPPSGSVLFIGSSSIRLWKTLAQDFSKFRVLNRGFGGSQVIDSVNYADRIVFPYKPRQIVMYAGGNDINAKKSPQQVFADFKTFVAKVHAELPRTKISYISIAPNPARWSQIAQVREANRLIEEFTRTDSRLAFIDTFSHMLGPDGHPLPDIFVSDRLHMNPKGYVIWTEVVGKHLRQ
jgi:lysophospholipase L1-like esterase